MVVAVRPACMTTSPRRELWRTPVRERPHRLPHESYRGNVLVAITACVKDGEPLFANPIAVDACTSCLRAATSRFACTVPVYCFMPEHLHVILRGAAPVADAWAAMAAFKQRSGFWIANHFAGFAWQKDFWDHIVRGDEDLRAQIRYVAENLVRRGLVRRWDQYPFTGSFGHDLHLLLREAGLNQI